VPENPVVDLALASRDLPLYGWASLVLGQTGTAKIKLFRVEPDGLAADVHHEWSESLIMLDGEIDVELDGSIHTVQAGQHIHIPAGQAHSIRPGGQGAFILVDPEPSADS
jgi:mannose-6-phosphate isomerase-like protein (cupin superfamily)